MIRVVILCTLFTALTAVEGHALQSATGTDPTHLYEAYYQVSLADMEAWNEAYFKYTVPAMDSLVEKGIVQGYTQWEHNTGGGGYNVRFAVRTTSWDALNAFWGEYLAQLEANAPPGEFERLSRMIQLHEDEIWVFDGIHVAPGYQSNFAYASSYRFNFGDEAEWSRLWNDVTGPIIDQAMADGLLGGWVRMAHHSGGPDNYKVLYLFDEWDDMDDFFATIGEKLMASDPEDLAAFGRLVQSHDDAIWVPTRPGGM